jgi:hypothetical protein
LVDFARKGGTTGPLECTDADGTTMAAERCLADLAQLRPDEISYTTLSPGCDRHEVDIYCRDVGVQDYDNGVRITFELRRGAKVPQRIIVARERDLSQVVSTALSHR